MKPLTYKEHIWLFLSGALAAYVISKAFFVVSWICYAPLFFLLKGRTVRQYCKSGLSFGLGVSVVSFFWMLGAAKEFSGNQFAYGFLVTTLSIILFCIYWSALFTLIGVSLNKLPKNIAIEAMIVASCFVLGEGLLNYLFSQMPYYLFNSGYGLLNNVYTIQWASFFGIPILNFFVLIVNYLITDLIIAKRWKQLSMPLLIILLTLTSGFLVKSYIDRNIVPLTKVNVAIAAENIPPQLKWDEQGGNILAQRLLQLNKSAALSRPDIVLWSESTIPWSYKSDDELLTEILKEPYGDDGAIHMIGYISEYSESASYNSIYGIRTDGRVLGRYDKADLLHFIEKKNFWFNYAFFRFRW